MTKDKYVGDAAWRQWFDICSVDGCDAEHSSRLREEITSAMCAEMSRRGFASAIPEGGDPVAHFDAYFLLGGNKARPKPLKQYYLDRIAAEGRSLRDFVCGTLFGAGAGRIHDIVRDWIAVIKGWKPHSLTRPDGTRAIVWEGAAVKDDVREKFGAVSYRPGAKLDRAALRSLANEMLESVSTKIKLEKSSVAFLLYVTGLDVSITSPSVIRKLGVAKSRAYTLRNETMKATREFFEAHEVEKGDPLLARVMMLACESAISADDLKSISGKEEV